jgi:DNA-binding transcriptional LysR family regulator
MNANEPDFAYLKKLWTLKTVVDSGNLKRASLKSKVSVSAVSQSISGLERSLGRKLFVKKDRRLLPTQYCLEILNSAEPAFRVFHDLEKLHSRSLCVPHIAWLNFGTSQCVASEILPRLVKRLKEHLPDLKLTLKVGRCPALVSRVKKGELCMALVAVDGEIRGLSSYPLYEDRLGIYVSARHIDDDEIARRLAKGIAGLSADVDGHPLYYTRFLRSFDEKLRVTLSCDTYETLYELAVDGSVAAILPERLALRHAGVLREITPVRVSAKAREAGKFTVRMISESACDPSEDEFLISELRSLI